MSGVTSRLEPLLRLLTSFESGISFDENIDLGLLNDVKEAVNAIISIALNDVKKRKEVRMCTALLFDENNVSILKSVRRF